MKIIRIKQLIKSTACDDVKCIKQATEKRRACILIYRIQSAILFSFTPPYTMGCACCVQSGKKSSRSCPTASRLTWRTTAWRGSTAAFPTFTIWFLMSSDSQGGWPLGKARTTVLEIPQQLGCVNYSLFGLHQAHNLVFR